MSEPSKSQSSKKAEPEEQPLDHERELSKLQGGAGASGEQGSNLLSDIEPETDGEEFTEEYPDWLLNLESKSIDIPLETGFPGSEKTGESSSPAGDIQPEDLPDWLLENYTPTPQADNEKAIEYEIPEWLQTSLDELSASEGDSEQLPASAGQPPEVGLPEDEAAFMVIEPTSEPDEPAASSPREPGDLETLLSLMDADNQSIVTLPGDEQIFLPGAEEADENFLEGIPPAPSADQSIETLAEVRHSLKDEEQAKPKKERPGFVERLTGWMVVSSHGQQQRIEQRLEGQMDQADTQASGTEGSEQTPGAEPKSPAEPLSSRQGEDSGSVTRSRCRSSPVWGRRLKRI